MKTSYLVASIIATAVLASPLAYSAPGHRIVHVFSEFAYGCTDGETACFFAYAYDEPGSGQQNGEVVVQGYDSFNSFYQIRCVGPAYANVVAVNGGNGNSSINATLDPSSSDCSYIVNVSAPVTLNVAGKYNGTYRYSRNGTGKEESDGVSNKFNFHTDFLYETFTGTNGFYTGTFNGYVNTEHRVGEPIIP